MRRCSALALALSSLSPLFAGVGQLMIRGSVAAVREARSMISLYVNEEAALLPSTGPPGNAAGAASHSAAAASGT